MTHPVSPPPLRVFISGGVGALAPYRQAATEVCYRLGLFPMLMDDQAASEEAERQAVQSCDVFVLLLGHRYGARPAGQRLSYTELEYLWAVERPHIAVVAFIVDPEFPWPPADIDFGADADALAALVAQVRSRHTVGRLAGLGAFREDLLIARELAPRSASPSAC